MLQSFKTVKTIAVATTAFLLMAFSGADKHTYPSFIQVGHRGTRGLMPENTIIAMEKGITIGANTVEMDVHITKDGQVMVYHDETFDPAYTLKPDGSEIDPKERDKYNFYQMNYADIRTFVIGKKYYNSFPQQTLTPTYAPLLGELIDSVDHYTTVNKLPMVYYLIEIKSQEKTDGINQPAPAEFVKTLMAVLTPKHLGDRLIIQSFDKRPIKLVHQNYPGIATGFLVDDKKVTFEQQMDDLGYTPEFYNPHYSLVNADFMKKCHDRHMLVCPWTANSVQEMNRLKSLHVDGIITDYPNYFAQAK